MCLLCFFCIVYIFFLFPGGTLLSVCVLTLMVQWQGVFSLLEGRCSEEGVEKLANDVFRLLFSTFVWLFLSYWLYFPHSLSYLNFIFVCSPVSNISQASVSGKATQADLTLDRGADGLGRGVREGKIPVRVEFTENSLTYMDRLLLRKHRRYIDRQTTMGMHYTYIF